MKITKIITEELNIEVEAYINISKKEIKFAQSKLDESKKIFLLINNMNQKELIVANENNVFITLYGINFKSNNKDTYIYSFKTIIIGAKGYNYLNNITSAKIKIMFQNSKGIFNPHTHKTINIPNTCKVNLNNNHILFSNCNLSYWDLNKTINNIANFLYLLCLFLNLLIAEKTLIF